ncbi:hypothetical protein S83_020192 [Arachis hypogaea]
MFLNFSARCLCRCPSLFQRFQLMFALYSTSKEKTDSIIRSKGLSKLEKQMAVLEAVDVNSKAQVTVLLGWTSHNKERDEMKQAKVEKWTR